MRIDDGHPTFLEFTSSAIFGTLLYEKTVKPPGYMGGGANPTTTMRNIRMRTKAPKKLLDTSDVECTMAYDTEAYEDLLAAMQVNQLIRVHYPDGSIVEAWGWLDEFEPNEVSEGEQPDADVTVIISNQDDTGAEVQPAWSAGST